MSDNLSQKTINRLTQYHSILREYVKKDILNITSSQISSLVDIDETQVRKDLKSINCKGKCKVGYIVKDLKKQIEVTLNFSTVKHAFVIGAGNLGVALTKYSKFSEFGLEIDALFDIAEDKIGLTFNDKPVYNLKDIKKIVKKSGVDIAILTTPNKVAQSVTDYLVEAGIKYIWNFAPSILTVPDDVKVWHENLIGSFLQFCAITDMK